MSDDLIGASFDLARASGYVLWHGSQPVKVATIILPEQATLGEKGSLFRSIVMERMPSDLDWVAFEDARSMSKPHGMILFGLTMILHEMMWNRGVPVLGFGQGTVKKALTGKGTAKKPDMVAAALERWPQFAPLTHDEADALGVGLAFLSTQQVHEK